MTIERAYVADCDECEETFEDQSDPTWTFDQAWMSELDLRKALRKSGWVEGDGEVLCKHCAAKRAKSEEIDADLFWHCTECGDHHKLDDEQRANGYADGDTERCTECGDGTAHVMTLKRAAAYEQGRALGLSKTAALERAMQCEPVRVRS